MGLEKGGGGWVQQDRNVEGQDQRTVVWTGHIQDLRSFFPPF